ncbi:trichohyalin-like [Oryzias melastigma]|uniref:trichohyalin-like n=1 Tax=Oryzias melastigma TaxID=30732 RepID=UPI000CF7EF3E|nr:trichohyalin-like [Oryzias melastigma]
MEASRRTQEPQVEIAALNNELQRLNQLLQQKDQLLADAALKVDHFEERMRQEKGLCVKAKTSLRSLKEEKQQWQQQQQQQHLDLSSKISLLEATLKEETARASKAESLAAEKVQQYDCAQAAMLQLGRAFQEKKEEMEKEKEHFIQEIAQLKAAQKQQQPVEQLDISSKISQLETNLQKETTRANEAERHLAQQKQETASAHASIVALRVQLQQKSQECEMQRSYYLHHHQLALAEAQNQLAKERGEWQRKNSSLNQEMDELRKVHEENVAATHRAEKSLLDLLGNIDQRADTLLETIKEKDKIINDSETIWKEKLDQQEKQLEVVKKAYRKKHFDLGQQLHQMEEKVKEERIQTNQAKLSFDLEVEESTKLRTALAQVQKDLDEQKQQRVKEKSTLSEEIARLHEVIKNKESAISNLEDAFTVQLDQIQQQVEELKEKPQKKSVGQRFMKLFKKSKKRKD